MMTRPCVVALLGLALLCGIVAGQDQGASSGGDTAAPPNPSVKATTGSTTTTTTAADSDADASAEPEPEPESEPEPEPDTDSDSKAKSEASFSNEDNGAALVSVSLPSLVLAAVLAKVYAH